ncbi:MAG: PilX N-terminal domain-containing pilus assembly protein [Woeseiaceae bacterium]|nr:PilX N-terminal domain-containing pilus assembly protein [Woeseiaceae bacterium]
MKRMTSYKKQNGAALVVGLILLVVITVLAISGMNTATTELAMARNDQTTENVFQAAETGIEAALAQGRWDTLATTTVTQNITANESFEATIEFEDSTLVPDRAFSLGVGSGINAYHFIATSTATSERDPGNPSDYDTEAVHTQAFYVVGPESPTL